MKIYPVAFPWAAALALITCPLVALAMTGADASLIGPAATRMVTPLHQLILAIAFAALAGSVVMPALIYAGLILLRFAWALVKVALLIVRDEFVKWILLAAAASLGLLQYLQCVPTFL